MFNEKNTTIGCVHAPETMANPWTFLVNKKMSDVQRFKDEKEDRIYIHVSPGRVDEIYVEKYNKRQQEEIDKYYNKLTI